MSLPQRLLGGEKIYVETQISSFNTWLLFACRFIYRLQQLPAGNNGGSANGDKVIKIGVFEPLTGENGGGGFGRVLGIRYANKVYPTVDINGETYNIELVEVDNKSDKTEAVSAAQSLIASGVKVV